jgi:type II secretory pathway pseudopilin PulG
MLVVIAIIGILASLITVVAARAIKSGNEAVRLAEIGQLAAAIKKYKADYGSVPPDCSNSAKLDKHIRKRFPRMSSSAEPFPSGISPAEALVLWLGGVSPDVTDPFGGSGKSTPLFDFDKSRLQDDGDGDDFYVYYPPDDNQNPYVYFDTSSGSGSPTYTPSGGQQIQPYNAVTDEFQIICAGLDKMFGGAGTYTFPNGPFPGGHADNLTSFSTKNLEDSIP